MMDGDEADYSALIDDVDAILGSDSEDDHEAAAAPPPPPPPPQQLSRIATTAVATATGGADDSGDKASDGDQDGNDDDDEDEEGFGGLNDFLLTVAAETAGTSTAELLVKPQNQNVLLPALPLHPVSSDKQLKPAVQTKVSGPSSAATSASTDVVEASMQVSSNTGSGGLGTTPQEQVAGGDGKRDDGKDPHATAVAEILALVNKKKGKSSLHGQPAQLRCQTETSPLSKSKTLQCRSTRPLGSLCSSSSSQLMGEKQSAPSPKGWLNAAFCQPPETTAKAPSKITQQMSKPLTAEQRAVEFERLLSDIAIHPDTPWENAMKLLVKDARYTLLRHPEERRRAYETYCAAKKQSLLSSHDNEAAPKKTSSDQPPAVLYFRTLLRRLAGEHKINRRTTWIKFLPLVEADPAYVDIVMTCGIAKAIAEFDVFVDGLETVFQKIKPRLQQVAKEHGVPPTLDRFKSILIREGLLGTLVEDSMVGMLFQEMGTLGECKPAAFAMKKGAELQRRRFGESGKNDDSGDDNVDDGWGRDMLDKDAGASPATKRRCLSEPLGTEQPFENTSFEKNDQERRDRILMMLGCSAHGL